jgi:hypothetical protein
MLLLEQPAKLDREGIVAAIRRKYPDLSEKLEGNIGTPPSGGGGLMLTMGSNPIVVMPIGAPLPVGTLDQATTGNVLWPDAARVLSRHHAHVIVASLQKPPHEIADRVTTAANVTRVCAAIASITSSLGIYWTTSETAFEIKRFQATTAPMSGGKRPIDVWVRLHLFKGNPNGKAIPIGCATMGLSSFVGREIEFEPSLLPPGIVAQRVQGTIAYLLEQGPVLKHGDTLGVSETERIRVEYADQGRHVNTPIYRLLYEPVGSTPVAQ